MKTLKITILASALFLPFQIARGQTMDPRYYQTGSPVLTDIWVDINQGNDAAAGTSRSQALRTLDEAWSRIPQGTTFTTTGYRLQLTAGTYPESALPAYMESRYGTFTHPVVIQSADGPGQAVIAGYLNIADCRYLYILDCNVIPNPAGDAIHGERCDHLLLHGLTVNGGGLAQETIKINQSQYVYIEDCDVSGAWNPAMDFVAVQYGHIVGNRIHGSGDWCLYIKGGSAYLRIEANEIFDGSTGGFSAGQGTGFEFMVLPWLHYEAYDIKFINNVIHDTDGAGMGVNGGYNILMAFNTLYRVGARSHAVEVVFGARGCDGNIAQSQTNRAAGGWGPISPGVSEPIPDRNVYIYNNVLYNPAGFQSAYSHFAIYGPQTPSSGSNIPNPSTTDTNLRIRGNVIWNGPADLALGVEDPGQGGQPSNPTCNAAQLRADNAINSFLPQLADPASGDFRPVAGGNLASAVTYTIPAFPGDDRPSPPTVPPGLLTNDISRDFLNNTRTGTTPPGALSFSAGTPTISLHRTALSFGAAAGGTSTKSQNVIISNSGAGTLNWTASRSQSWIEANPLSGSGTETILVSVNPSGLSAGAYSGTVTVSCPGATNSPRTIAVNLTVYGGGAVAVPFGSFDTPIDGSAVSSSIAVTGWALDDIEVTGVKIYRNPVAGEGANLVYIGDAIFVEGARPDVEQSHPSLPLNYRAGWGYMMLTNFLPNGGNGTFTLHAIAADKEGHQVNLGQKTIPCDNLHATKPFGAIDTPSQGGTASGVLYHNFGWALTPMPNSIPVDGSTITVYIDGLPIGHPIYNNYRSDIATLFPGYANSNGAVGVYSLDMTGYSNGVHTIAWVVSDSVGAADGIGSRFFNVLNTGSGSPASRDIAKFPGTAGFREETKTFPAGGFIGGISNRGQAERIPSTDEIQNLFADTRSPIFVRRGYDFSLPAEPRDPDHNGILKLTISELERVTIHLDPGTAAETLKELEVRGSELLRTNISPGNTPGMNLGLENKSGRNSFSAYLIVGAELRPLPRGSTFDAERGVLYWQPGPGFLGDYDFLFVDGTRNRKRQVSIRISPK